MKVAGHSSAHRVSLVMLALLLLVGIAAHAQEKASSPVQAVDAIEITVSDMDRAVDFYSRVLDFKKISDLELIGESYEHLEGVFGLRIRAVRMQLGQEQIELEEFLVPKGVAIPQDSRSNDRWFQHIAIIVSDMDAAFNWLRHNKVEFASSGPQLLPEWNKNAAGIRAFYFKDPDGHPLELLQVPPDKGDPKWHRSSGHLFLGIDHTAIVVSDTEASLRFYRDLLGMRVAGESENYGTEQEHLNNVFGARLRITALRACAGPGIELLEYLAARDGRPFPSNERANDLVRRETELVNNDLSSTFKALLAAHSTFISPGLVSLSPDLGYMQALAVRDPDGHVIRIHNGTPVVSAKTGANVQNAQMENRR
ncbi:MAG: glyoxalase [Acidobacteria bacterium]|nr:MAG: glyoxalase [Acidobacteriota bacterium]